MRSSGWNKLKIFFVQRLVGEWRLVRYFRKVVELCERMAGMEAGVLCAINKNIS